MEQSNTAQIEVGLITPSGRLDAFNIADLRDAVTDYLDQGICQLVIDLSQTTFFDSAAMAVLVSGLKRSRQLGGDLKLVSPQVEEAQRIFHLTRFDRVFDMVATAAEARNKFGV